MKKTVLPKKIVLPKSLAAPITRNIPQAEESSRAMFSREVLEEALKVHNAVKQYKLSILNPTNFAASYNAVLGSGANSIEKQISGDRGGVNTSKNGNRDRLKDKEKKNFLQKMISQKIEKEQVENIRKNKVMKRVILPNKLKEKLKTRHTENEISPLI